MVMQRRRRKARSSFNSEMGRNDRMRRVFRGLALNSVLPPFVVLF
jgi:hypothetical protein